MCLAYQKKKNAEKKYLCLIQTAQEKHEEKEP